MTVTRKNLKQENVQNDQNEQQKTVVFFVLTKKSKEKKSLPEG